MSNALTNACRNINTNDLTAKFVLMTMCDIAKDDGTLYPSISFIAKRICGSEKTVERAIKKLVELGLLTKIKVNGRNNEYVITPKTTDNLTVQTICTTDYLSVPPQTICPEPQTICPEPPSNSRTTHHYTSIETSLDTSVSTPKKKTTFAKPDDVTQQTWIDFVTHRKAKKALITQTAMNGFIREAAKAGISLETAIIFTVEAGWVGFKSDWYANAIKKQQPATSQSKWDNWQANKTEVDVTPKKNYLTVVNGGYTHV